MKTVKKTSVKKYQAGGKVKDTGKVVVKDRKDKEGIEAERAKGNTVYIPKPKALMQKGGATNVGKSTTTKKGSMATMSKTPITPKAAYGMAVKPGMMKKGGTTKKSK